MFETIKIGKNSFYTNAPVKIGIYQSENNQVYLIDSGTDKAVAKRVLKHLRDENLEVKAILSTHSHADHIGGNEFFQQETNCKIYAKGIEQTFSENSFLGAGFMFGGIPFKEIQNKFLYANPSKVDFLTEEVLPKGLSMVDLQGHSHDMTGFRTEDGIVFLGDALTSPEILEKHPITYTYDIARYLKTLQNVKVMEAKIFVPSHTPITEKISELAQYNIDKIHEIAQVVLEICKEALSFDIILNKIFNHYNLKMDFQEYILAGSTVKSYLVWLKEKGDLEVFIKDNLLLWKTKFN